jgi:2,5-diamino-6-(ribosylamino)-4(3H)-pyrimidinone 5'-phosphate reductase
MLKKNILKIPVSFIIIDNKPHLNKIGVEYYIKRSKMLYLVTSNKNHPVFEYINE